MFGDPSTYSQGIWKTAVGSSFPTKYVIPKSLKFSHWPSKHQFLGSKCYLWGLYLPISTAEPSTVLGVGMCEYIFGVVAIHFEVEAFHHHLQNGGFSIANHVKVLREGNPTYQI